MRNSKFLWIIIAIMVLMDLYVFQALKTVLHSNSPRTRYIVFGIYWTISIAAIVLLILLPTLNYTNWPKWIRTYLFATVVGLFFSKLIACLFFLVDDVRRVGMWLIGKLFSNPSVEISDDSKGITRSVFMSWLGLAV